MLQRALLNVSMVQQMRTRWRQSVAEIAKAISILEPTTHSTQSEKQLLAIAIDWELRRRLGSERTRLV
jgi:hypothetical protein